jgi:hypothetical protein
MKKYVYFLLISIGVSPGLFAQSVQIGVKASPTITFNRWTSNSDSIAITNSRDDTRFTFGLVADFELKENYFFSTGLLYSLRKLSFDAVNLNTLEVDSEQYTLEYLEIPITLKLFTNDVGVDSKIYFQPGFTLDFLVNWKGINKNDTRITDLNFFDSSFYVGAGYDRKIGVSNSFFVGLFYQRGLVNLMNENPEVDLKNDLLGLDLGFRF